MAEINRTEIQNALLLASAWVAEFIASRTADETEDQTTRSAKRALAKIESVTERLRA